MSENYYLTLRRDDGRYDWSVKVHLGKCGARGFTLQAVLGRGGLDSVPGQIAPSDQVSSVLVHVPDQDLPTIWTWEGWKQVLTSRTDLVVIDEIDQEHTAQWYIEQVQSQDDRRAPHEHQLEWADSPAASYLRGFEHTHYLDPEGYSFCWRSFS